MKRQLLTAISLLLMLALLFGCSKPQTEPTPTEDRNPTTEQTDPTPNGDGNVPPEEHTPSYYINEVYSQQIGRYYTPLWELWDASKYLDNGLSLLPSYYCVGNPLENVGFGLVDLDKDGSWELVIGAISNADINPSVFEIWTLVNGEPVLLAQSNSDNRYLLQYAEAEQAWYVVNEASINIASDATYYLKLNKGALQIVQGVVFDAFYDEENPWFLTHDLDWDVSNDTPIDGESAAEILESNRQLYKALEYIPYTQYLSADTQPSQTTPAQQLNKRAEALSQRFGLDIRIPAQEELVYNSYDATALTDLITIRYTLDVLENTLSLYPEGFFRQLIYGPIESVRLELVGSLTVQEGSGLDPNSTSAFAHNRGDYYLIVLNGFSIYSRTLFHEFSHLIDARLNWDARNREDALFRETAWQALQPEGFHYTMSYIDIPDALQRFVDSGDFLNRYSMSFPTEDRAELMATAMENLYQAFEADSGKRAKLQYYADCIRDCFNTEGWPETLPWEQVL